MNIAGDEAQEREPSAAELVSQLAQGSQKIHEEAQREARREHPDFLLDIEQSEVLYTLPPQLLPLRFVDYEALRQILEQKWGLRLHLSEVKFEALMATLTREEIAQLSEDELMQHLLRSDDPMLVFRAGKYQVSDHEFVPIVAVRVNFETVLVGVAGISRIAEAVAVEVLELVWACAGAVRRWKDLEPEILRAGYATRTRVKLGVPFERLLNPTMREFLDTDMVDGAAYASHLGHYEARHELGPAPNAISTYAVDDLNLRCTRYDPDGGTFHESVMTFSVRRKGDYGRGVVSVASELPYDIHVACLKGLIGALGESS